MESTEENVPVDIGAKKKQTLCWLVKAVTTLLTVVRSAGENSNIISSNSITMSCPPVLEAGIK